MTVESKISKGLANAAQKAVVLLAEMSDPSLPLLAPLDNFVVWRAEFLDLNSIDPEKIIWEITYAGQEFVLIWNKPEDPHHG